MELRLDPIDNSPEPPAPVNVPAADSPPNNSEPTVVSVPVSQASSVPPSKTFGETALNPESQTAVNESSPETPANEPVPAITPSTAAAIASSTPSPATDASPAVMVGGDFAPDPGPVISVSDTGEPAGPIVGGPSRRPSMKLIAVVATLLLIIGGGTAFYFGYYMNPSVIYSQSLGNTGKGYDKLISYVDTQSRLKNQSYTGTGSFTYKASDFSADGKLGFQGSDSGGELTFDVGLAGSRITADVRAIKQKDTAPDLYVKASGLKGLGGLLGLSGTDEAAGKIDNTWIFIDHTLLDSVSGGPGISGPSGPSREAIFDEARAFGKVNQSYVFTTDKDKAVTTIVKNYGKETVNGHKTYHYQLALQKENVKKYITAQKDAFKASKLGAWLKKNKYENAVYSNLDDASKAADKIKSTDTFDIWMDTSHRVVYKVRVKDSPKNPAQNYTEAGFDYQGGNSYPFFLGGKSKIGDFGSDSLLVGTLNTKTGVTTIKFDLSTNFSGANSTNLKAEFTLTPSSKAIKIEKPAGAKPLNETALYSGLQDRSKDSKRHVDMSTIQVQLESYFSQNGHYPSLTDINSAVWRSANMKDLDEGALTDPDNPSGSKMLAFSPLPFIYSYAPTNSAAKSCEATDTTCSQYKLTATLSDGSKLVKESLN